jgi:DNA-binding transcriptional LysR family regulator
VFAHINLVVLIAELSASIDEVFHVVAGEPPYPGLSLYYPANRHRPAGLQAFIGVVREVMSR